MCVISRCYNRILVVEISLKGEISHLTCIAFIMRREKVPIFCRLYRSESRGLELGLYARGDVIFLLNDIILSTLSCIHIVRSYVSCIHRSSETLNSFCFLEALKMHRPLRDILQARTCFIVVKY